MFRAITISFVLPCVAACALVSVVRTQVTSEPDGPGAQEAAREKLLAAATAYAKRVAKTMTNGDPSLYDGRLDADAFVARVTKDLKLPAGFALGLKQGIGQANIGAANIQASNGTLTFAFLRLRERPLRALFRMSGDMGLDYHELELVRGKNGEFGWVDLYRYSEGEQLSAAVRRNAVAVSAEMDRSLLDRLSGKETAFVDSLETTLQIEQLMVQGQSQAALKLFDGLPEVVRKTRTMMLRHMVLTSTVEDDRRFQKACEEFKTAYPGDPALALNLIDYYFVRQEWDQVRKMVDLLDRAVGGDPYLETLRAVAEMENDKVEDAKLRLLKLTEKAPDLEDAWATLLTVSLRAKDHPLTVVCLDRLEQFFGYEWPDLTTFDEYADFVVTEEYKAWKKR